MNRVAVLSTLLVLTATAQAKEFSNSAYLNSAYLNSAYLNSAYLNSAYLNSATLANGTTVSGMTTGLGRTVSHAYLDGSIIRGTAWTPNWRTGTWSWQPISTTDLVGGRIMTQVSDGSTRYTSIAAQTFSTTGVSLLTVNVWVGDAYNNWGWQPLCGVDDAGAPILAVPVQGEWNWDTSGLFDGGGGRYSRDKDKIIFACINSAIGKCAASGATNTLGYSPWINNWYERPVDGTWVQVDGYDLHETCVRMVRADYCGAGQTFTQTGNPIDVTDYTYYQVNQPGHNYANNAWVFEGLWSRFGVTRMGCDRAAATDLNWQSGAHQCPAVYSDDYILGWKPGVLIEIPCYWGGVDPLGNPMPMGTTMPDSPDQYTLIGNRTGYNPYRQFLVY